MIEEKLKPFFTSLMGSFPRGDEIMKARRLVQARRLEPSELDNIIEDKTREVVELQDSLGLDYIVSGELSRDNYVSFIASKLYGVREMTMSEMLDYIDDKQSFEVILSTLDVPASSIKNAICAGEISRKSSLVKDELDLIRKFTNKPAKLTLPGPYLTTRSMWLPELSEKAYSSKEELGERIIEIYKEEIDALCEAGADLIQLDEPVLTEVVFSPTQTRTFMCAALSQKKDPAEELEFACHLIKSVVHYAKEKELTCALHVCRGNWSRDESILLSGPYTPLLDLFSEVAPDILALEFSTPRAGELGAFLKDSRYPANTTLGLGVQNPRSDEIESSNDICARAREALEYLPPDRIGLNPDCGFATFSPRPVSTDSIIKSKIEALVEASSILRSEI